MVSSWVDPDVIAACAARIPLVIVGRPAVVPPGVDHVANDDAHGAAIAVEHLADLGHREIAFLSRSDRPAAMARRDGYVDALLRRRLPPPGTWVATSDDAFRRVLDEVLTSQRTAVLANNDLTAIALLDRANDLGIEIPRRLSVVGYDDTALAATVRPRLTSVDQLSAALGSTAMAMLGERLAGRSDARAEVLRPVLRVRASTAAPG